MTAPTPRLRGTDWQSGTSLTPEQWARMLTALDAGAPPAAACRYAGISLATWERKRQRTPEFGIEADRVEASGYVAAWRFLQVAAASEWRASLEYLKLHGATRGKDAVRLDEPAGDDPDADVTPDDVAAVVRVLRAHELADGGAGSGVADLALRSGVASSGGVMAWSHDRRLRLRRAAQRVRAPVRRCPSV